MHLLCLHNSFCTRAQDIQTATEPAPEAQRTPLLERQRRGVRGDAATLRPLLGKASGLLGSVRRGSLTSTISLTLALILNPRP